MLIPHLGADRSTTIEKFLITRTAAGGALSPVVRGLGEGIVLGGNGPDNSLPFEALAPERDACIVE